MLKALSKFDDLLFDASWGFQRFVSVLQYYFGIKPTSLASLCFIIGESALIFYWLDRDSPDLSGVGLGFIVTLGLINAAAIIEKQQKTGTRNNARVALFVPRLLVVWFGLAAVAVGVTRSLWFLGEFPVIAGTYFVCCDFLPPLKRFQWSGPRLARVAQ